MTIILALVILCRSIINILMLSTSFIRGISGAVWMECQVFGKFKNLPPGDYSFKVKAKFANAT
jgi:hypothetical protein